MATTTPNFGWAVPTSTDLVKDGAVAIETLGDSIDASLVDLKGGTTGQVLKKNSNTDMDFIWGADSAGMTNPMTTTGDTIYSSSGSTPARLGIGSNGQVLTVASGIPSWATPAGGSGKTWTLINTGGTSLSGSSSVTVSGISGKEDLLILVYYAPITNASSEMQVRFNGDTGSNYTSYYNTITASSSYSVDSYNAEVNQNANYITIGKTSNNNTSEICAGMTVSGCKSTGIKNFWFNGGGSAKTGTGHVQRVGQGIYSASAAITSVNVSAGSNFTGGTLYVYGAQL